MMPLSRAAIRALCFSAAVSVLSLPAMAEGAKDNAIIVFDASGSMWGQIDGVSKIEIARQTLDRVVGTLPQNLQLGMIAYGHNRKGDCRDIEMMVEVGPAAQTGRRIAQSLRRIKPKGKTPLSDAVRMAADQLRYTEDKATVILVTDGIETCNADPCALASQLEQSGIDFTTHVVGFGLSDDEGRQVACLAENTGGLYLPADNADELADALGKTIVAEPVPPVKKEPPMKKVKHNFIGTLVLSEGGEPLSKDAMQDVAWFIQPLDEGGNPVGKRKKISHSPSVKWSGPAGRYQVSVDYMFGGKLARDIELDDFAVLKEDLVLNAGRLTGVGAFMRDDFAVDWSAMVWQIQNGDSKKRRSLYGYSTNLVVPAGRYDVSFGMRGEKAEVNPPRSIEVAAGEVKQMDFILPISKVSIEALEADGSRNSKIRQRISLRRADGSAGKVIEYEASAKPLFLRPGQYVASIEIWDGSKRKPVSTVIDVGLGEEQAFTVQLP